MQLPPGYTVRPFLAGDLAAYPAQAAQLRAAAVSIEAFRAAMQAAERGPNYTTLKDGVPVCSGGVMLTQTGNGTAWQIDAGDVARRPKLHLALAREFLALAEETWGLWRIEATADATDPRFAHWLQHLGFVRESCKRSVRVPGDTHWLYARIRKGP
jgi:hypothetical protein